MWPFKRKPLCACGSERLALFCAKCGTVNRDHPRYPEFAAAQHDARLTSGRGERSMKSAPALPPPQYGPAGYYVSSQSGTNPTAVRFVHV